MNKMLNEDIISFKMKKYYNEKQLYKDDYKDSLGVFGNFYLEKNDVTLRN